MNEFRDLLAQYPPEEVDKALASITPERVEQALAKTERDLEDFLALISSAAAPYLEKMAQKSRQLTLQRFGNNMQLFAPLYLSNECQNICT